MSKYKLTKRGKNVAIGLIILIIMIVVFILSSINNNLENVQKELGVSENNISSSEDILKNSESQQNTDSDTNDISKEIVNNSNTDIGDAENIDEITQDDSSLNTEEINSEITNESSSFEDHYNIYFDADSYIIKEKYFSILDKVIADLKNNDVIIVVEGNYNGAFDHKKYLFIDLSLNRALVVKNYFIDNGIDANRIEVVNNEDRNPINKDNSDLQLSLNRRTEIYFKKKID
ncbi:OmpA family protein [Helicovermis profundi]|uniref:OmpA-like domain-containing protein n=1 Tax=Helicovermis profundi TaxID=3065157 RepID=A0AAU9EFZ1_9FIRM|nr:hypothetical protein HLPR_27700 [Clostridia bacterium S502]